jgi:hypothetical protein
MYLWELRSIGTPMPDTVLGFIVRAETAAAARKLAREKAGDEGGYIWLNGEQSTCVELLPDGDPCVVMADFNAE